MAMPLKDSPMRDVGKYLGLALLLPSSALVGWGMGYGLDKLFHTGFLKLTFLLLGIASGFIQLVKELSQDGSTK